MKAKLTITHDRLTLSMSEPEKRTLNLTISRRGKSASGKLMAPSALQVALKKFDLYLKGAGVYREAMEALKVAAEKSENIASFLAGRGTTNGHELW